MATVRVSAEPDERAEVFFEEHHLLAPHFVYRYRTSGFEAGGRKFHLDSRGPRPNLTKWRKEFEQEAYIGLYEAGRTYTPDKGAPSTWAAYYIGRRLDDLRDQLLGYHRWRKPEREAKGYPRSPVSFEDLPWNVELNPSPSAEDEALEELGINNEERGHTLRILPKEGGGRQPPPDKETGTRGGQVARQLADAFGVRDPRPEQLARAEAIVRRCMRRVRTDASRTGYNRAVKTFALAVKHGAKETGNEDVRKLAGAVQRRINRDLKRMEK